LHAYPIGNTQRNAKYVQPQMTRHFSAALFTAAATLMTFVPAAEGGECPRKDALGTSRVLAVEAASLPRVGLKSFPQTLPLDDGEVVLTFDDGPSPPTDQKILAALAQECVRATFFLIGRQASAYPELVRRMAAQGHTIAHHGWAHSNLKYMNPEAAIAAVETALHGAAKTVPSTPFFRFPYFEMTPAILETLQKRDIAVFGADLWASDWTPMTPAQQLKLLTDRLQVARKGIILLHDPKAQTASMLPGFLRYLRDHHYRVVHLVPASAKTVSGKPQ
jgi:peptidoglycan/xylan/chitin deacetylase (PgdA/CDA1 family)